MKNNINIFRKTTVLFLILITAGVMVSCVGDELFRPDIADSNSQVDTIFPTADFSYASDAEDYRLVYFTDLSTEGTIYLWDFGGGATSTLQDPTYTFPGEATYTVTLTTSDANGMSDSVTMDVIVVEPLAFLPTILEASFEDDTLPGGGGDGRASWRNSDLGGVIQITGSPVNTGSQASKYPQEGDRIAYQELVVTPDTDYTVSFYYTLASSPSGSVTVSILPGGGHADLATALSSSIASFSGTDQSDSNSYVQASVPFNSGDNNLISILVTNQGAEARIDDFEIDLN